MFFGAGKFYDHDPISGLFLEKPTIHDSSVKVRGVHGSQLCFGADGAGLSVVCLFVVFFRQCMSVWVNRGWVCVLNAVCCSGALHLLLALVV